MRLIDRIPGLRLHIEKLDAGIAADPKFRRRYLSGEIDINGRLIPRSPATVVRLKQRKLETGRIAYFGHSASGPTASFLGGSPDQTDALDWPTWEGRKLSFLAQIDLAELHDSVHLPWLPGSGKLLFFVGQNEYEQHSAEISRIIHVSAGEPSAGARRDLQTRQYVSFERRMSYAPLGPEDDAGQVDDNRELEDWYFGLFPAGHLTRWQVGGWPRPLQHNDMRHECERRYRGLEWDDFASQNTSCFQQALDTWHLIGQFDAEGLVPGSSEFMLGYFWVKVENGRAQFDRAILLGQSD